MSNKKVEIKNTNEIWKEVISFGQKSSDLIAKIVGSWKFIIIQSILLLGWMSYNLLGQHFDPYPFILLNLVLSFQAAFSSPIIMMSQNRQEEKDRIKFDNNYEINKRTETETEDIIKQLNNQNKILVEILEKLEKNESR